MLQRDLVRSATERGAFTYLLAESPLLALPASSLLQGTGSLCWYQNVGPGYYSELETIRRQLQGIPQVELLELHGHDDDNFPLLRSLEHITA